MYHSLGSENYFHSQKQRTHLIFDGFWYLLAKSGDLYIKYYLKEIRELRVLEQTFAREEKVTQAMERAIGIWFDPSAEPFDITLLLDSDAIVYFERKPIKGQYLKKMQTAQLNSHLA